MRNFNLSALREWKQVAVGEVLDFPIPDTGYRSVSFDLVADSHISVHAVSDDGAWLVGAGDGQLSIKFSIDEPVGVVCQGDASAEIFIRTLVNPAVIPESLDPSYTTIEPRPAGPSDELRQMMQIVRLNNERRERQLLAEIHRLQEERESVVIEAPAPEQPAPEVTDGQ